MFVDASPIISNINRQAWNRILTLLLISMLLSACLPKQAPEPEPVVSAPIPEPEPPQLSTEAIKPATYQQILLAQTALKKLGYPVGRIDGLWGPQSAIAIQQFERQEEIASALGHLSEASLARLTALTGIQLDELPDLPAKQKKRGISQKVAEATIKQQGPQLIIIERDYTLFSKRNPYSRQIEQLRSGTGVYIVKKYEGWYQVESTAGKRGFIQAD